MTEPTQTCQECGAQVIVRREMGEFPPDVAKAQLAKICKAKGHESRPVYRAGLSIGGRYEGQ